MQAGIFMKHITLKIILSLFCCSLIIALILSGTAISKSRAVMQEEVKRGLVHASAKYASQFSRELKTHENAVDLISTVVSSGFTASKVSKDRLEFLKIEENLADIIRLTMEDIPETKSLYVTFNPKTSGGNDEVWYLRNEAGEVFHMEADNTVTDWLVDGKETDAYYFQAIRKGKNWSGVEYDKYLGVYSVTYSRACNDKYGQLIGVAGTDIFIDDMLDTVKNIQMEAGGYAFLMDGAGNYLAGSTSEEIFMEMKQAGILNLPDHIAPADKEGVVASEEEAITYAEVKGDRYLTAYSKTTNGWILALSQSENHLLLPILHLKQMIYTIAGLILSGVLIYSFYFSKISLSPIVREYEQKDVIMHHQSRQAKLGEMVGNIAHQWKQPLNVMSITLSNLWDDWKQGNLTEQQLREHISNMRSYIKNMSGTVDDFADFLKPSRKKDYFSLADAVDTALSLMQESIKINRITVIEDSEVNLNAYGYKNEFCHGVFNVLNNARDAIIESGIDKREIRIKIYSGQGSKQKGVSIIDIENNGSRIPEESLQQVFDPYFTTKEEKGGTGIGLYLTKEIIEAHMAGTIELFNTETGVCCRMIIPREDTHERS
ncbi:sensor histidine kinase [Anoxybacterium hadale]|uniref:Sensor histidine kinase n=1 Tax=Anoxybacterium hadale TaxID=3408580 RepID=A0ACD1ACS7_9FIRM|nr:sensor histidine kinase [Clostridiales bacterium]